MTAQALVQLGVIDRIVPAPVGGAHRDPKKTAQALGSAIGEELDALAGKTPKQLRKLREERFLAIGDSPRGLLFCFLVLLFFFKGRQVAPPPLSLP